VIDDLLSIAVIVFISIITDDCSCWVPVQKLQLIAKSLAVSAMSWTGLYADKALKVARKELAWECDYIREAKCCEKFR